MRALGDAGKELVDRVSDKGELGMPGTQAEKRHAARPHVQLEAGKGLLPTRYFRRLNRGTSCINDKSRTTISLMLKEADVISGPP